MTSCRDCALYDLDAVKGRTGRVQSHKVARCLWVSTEVYPASKSQWDRRPTTHWMQPNDGADCACFTPRTEP